MYKIGDEIVCVGMNPTYNNKCTIGKLYIIESIEAFYENKAVGYGIESGLWFSLVNHSNTFNEKYFVPATVEAKQRHYFKDRLEEVLT